MSHLMRVLLPDVPGALGNVATAIGLAGANIEALEILQRTHDGRVIDDVFVEMPAGVMPDAVVSQVQQIEGAEVLWISRYPAAGNLYLDLEAIEIITEDPARAIQRLVAVMPATFRCDWAMVMQLRDGRVECPVATDGVPEPSDGCQAWFPIEGPLVHDVEADDTSCPGWGPALVGTVPLGGPDRMIVFGRRGGPEILRSELMRLDYIASLAVSVERAVR